MYQNKARSLHKTLLALLEDDHDLHFLFLTHLVTPPPLPPSSGPGGIPLPIGHSGGREGGREGGADDKECNTCEGGLGASFLQQQQQQQHLLRQKVDSSEAEELLESYLEDLYAVIVRWELIKEVREGGSEGGIVFFALFQLSAPSLRTNPASLPPSLPPFRRTCKTPRSTF